MKATAILAATVATLASTALAFVPPAAAPAPLAARKTTTVTPMMALNAELTKTYPRDFKAIPVGTSYGRVGACVPCVFDRWVVDRWIDRVELGALTRITRRLRPSRLGGRQGPGRAAEQGDRGADDGLPGEAAHVGAQEGAFDVWWGSWMDRIDRSTGSGVGGQSSGEH